MMLFGVPVPLRPPANLVHTVADWLANGATLRPAAAALPRAHFVWFSWRGDWEYLVLSLRSLERTLGDALDHRLHVFEDNREGHTFTADQRAALLAAHPGLELGTVENFAWASVPATYAEVGAYLHASRDARPTDYIVGCDSDVLFFARDKLFKALATGQPFVGDGHKTDYRFAHGGLHLFRVAEFRALFAGMDFERFAAFCTPRGLTMEDRTMSAFYVDAGLPPRYTRLMLHPDEYRRCTGLSRFARWDFCALHFVKDKAYMPQYAARHGLA